MLRRTFLLSRYAEGLFWMARYLERVENLARLIDVTQSFESPGRESEAWFALVRINADEADFLERGLTSDAASVKHYYMLDLANATSILSSLEAARHNARTLRPLIATEMWRQLNIFHRDVLAIDASELEGDRLSALCTRIKEGVQAQTGITAGTFYRDQGHYFYQLGRLIERADQTTRLLDIRYHLLVAGGHEERRLTEITQWGGILRAAAGYHAFRRVARPGFTPEDVVSFLLQDKQFPRSVGCCLDEIDACLTHLRGVHNLRGTAPALERVDELRNALFGQSASDIIIAGLHEFLDALQSDLILLAGEIGSAFFPAAPPPRVAETSRQSQS